MKRYIKSAQDKQKYKFTFEISQIWYEGGEVVDSDTWQESASATAENPLNARIKIENRLEKKYGSKNDEYELIVKVIDGPDGYKDNTKYSSREGYIKSSQETYQLYQNKRNENKYIEVKKAKDGHTYYRQFMYWNTDRGPVKNYSGSVTNRGRYHRTRLDSLEQVLEDYVPVDGVHSEEDVFESTAIRSSWPEELTYDEYPEGDQIIEGLIQAVDYLDIFEEPSTQGGVGSDFFFTSDGEELGSIDIQEEEDILSDLYHSSKSKEDYHKKVKIWLANFLNL